MPERRKHYRLYVELDVKSIDSEGIISCLGKTTNISFGGLMVKCPRNPEFIVGSTCRVSISLPTLEGGITYLEFDCLVTHNNSGLFGLKFMPSDKINDETYNSFKSFMLLHCPDPEVILEELFNNDPIGMPA